MYKHWTCIQHDERGMWELGRTEGTTDSGLSCQFPIEQPLLRGMADRFDAFNYSDRSFVKCT